MAKKGVSKISGPKNPKIGQPASYNVTEWYPATPLSEQKGANVKWELFRKRSSGEYTSTNIIKKGPIGTFTFEEKAVGHEFFVEGYLNSPEKRGSTIVYVKPVRGEPKISRLRLLDSNKNAISKKPKYGQTLYAEVKTQNMFNEKLQLQVWERDTFSDTGHDSKDNTLLYEREITVALNGINYERIVLTELMMKRSQGGNSFEGEHEYYLVVKHNRKATYSTQTVQVLNEKIPVEGFGGNPLPEPTKSPAQVDPGQSQQPKEENCKCCRIDEEVFFTNYEKEFPRRNKKGNLLPMRESLKESLRKVFRGIRQYYSKEERDCDIRKIAYMLATARHETAHTFNPIKEYGGKRYFEGMYDPILGKNEKRRKMALENENTQQGDGVKYCGRGFVQVTWKKNYRKMGEKFGVDLVQFPEKALEHDLAIKIMIYGSEEGTFTGRALGDYINEKETDYYNARRVINGTDKASTIQGYAEKIEKCLKIKKCRD